MNDFESVLKNEPLFAETVCAVPADDFARIMLAQKFKDLATWEPNLHSRTFKVGQIAKRDIYLTVTWVRVNSHAVMFYYCSSPVCDYDQIEDWVQNQLPKSVGKKHMPNPDPMNFGPDRYCPKPTT